METLRQSMTPGRLTKLGRPSRKNVFAFEVLWTPDDAMHEPKPHKWMRMDSEKHIHFMKKFYNKDYPFTAKILWLTVIALCSAITMVQVHDRINYYLSQPVTINLQVHRNTTMQFPSITICNKTPFRKSALSVMARKLSAKLGPDQNLTTNDLINEYGIATLMEKATYKIPEYILERSQPCKDAKQWKPVNTTLGSCSTYTTETGQISTAGTFQAFYLTLKADEEPSGTERGWKILIHHITENPDILIQSNGITVYPDTRADFVVSLRQFTTVNRATQSCEADPTYTVRGCEADCLYRILSTSFSCRLPHMKIPEYSICNTSAEYNAMNEKRTEFLVNRTLWNVTDCGCLRQCSEDMYSTKFDIRYSPNQAKTVVKIYYEDLTYERVEEILSYKIVSLLSDIGGNLGLFLGICVLKIFEIMEQLVLWLSNKLKTGNGTKISANRI